MTEPGPDEPGSDKPGPDERGRGRDETGPERGPAERGKAEGGPDERGPDERGPDERGPEESGSEEAHPAVELNETVHQRARLGILTVLSEVSECTFTAMRDQLSLTDGNLSRHVRILEEADLVEVHKGYDGRRPCTWLRLTRQGRRALRTEMAALQRLVTRFHAGAADDDVT